MARRKQQLNNSTVVVVNKPPWHIYIGIGTPLLIAFIVFCVLFWPVIANWLFYVSIGTGVLLFGGAWLFIRGSINQQSAAIEERKLQLRLLTANVEKAEAEAQAAKNAARYPAIDRTKYLFDAQTGAVIVEAMPNAIPGQAKLLPDGEQPQQRRTLHQLIEIARHIAFLGETGSGKTSQMSHAIEAQIHLNPGALSIVMDSHIKKNTWPVVSETIWRYEDMAARVHWLFGELDKRTNPQNDDDWQTIIVAIDELPAVMDECREIDKNTRRYFTRLLREAWKFDIFFVVGTQSQLADDIDLNSATRKNFWWFGLEPEMTRRNVGMLLDNKFRPVEEIELAGPYYGNGSSGGRFFSRSLQLPALPTPTEPEPPEDELKLNEFKRLVKEEGMLRKDACRQVYDRPYTGDLAMELAKALKN